MRKRANKKTCLKVSRYIFIGKVDLKLKSQ